MLTLSDYELGHASMRLETLSSVEFDTYGRLVIDALDTTYTISYRGNGEFDVRAECYDEVFYLKNLTVLRDREGGKALPWVGADVQEVMILDESIGIGGSFFLRGYGTVVEVCFHLIGGTLVIEVADSHSSEIPPGEYFAGVYPGWIEAEKPLKSAMTAGNWSQTVVAVDNVFASVYWDASVSHARRPMRASAVGAAAQNSKLRFGLWGTAGQYQRSTDGSYPVPLQERFLFTVSDRLAACGLVSLRGQNLRKTAELEAGMHVLATGEDVRVTASEYAREMERYGVLPQKRQGKPTVGRLFFVEHNTHPKQSTTGGWMLPWQEPIGMQDQLRELTAQLDAQGHAYGVYMIGGLALDPSLPIARDEKGERRSSIWGSQKWLLREDAAAAEFVEWIRRAKSEYGLEVGFDDVRGYMALHQGNGHNADHTPDGSGRYCAEILAHRREGWREAGELLDGPLLGEGPRLASDYGALYGGLGGLDAHQSWAATGSNASVQGTANKHAAEISAPVEFAVTNQPPAFATLWGNRLTQVPALPARLFNQGVDIDVLNGDQLYPHGEVAYRRRFSMSLLSGTCAGVELGRDPWHFQPLRHHLKIYWTLRQMIAIGKATERASRKLNPVEPFRFEFYLKERWVTIEQLYNEGGSVDDIRRSVVRIRSADGALEIVVNRSPSDHPDHGLGLPLILPMDGWTFHHKPTRTVGAHGFVAPDTFGGELFPSGRIEFYRQGAFALYEGASGTGAFLGGILGIESKQGELVYRTSDGLEVRAAGQEFVTNRLPAV